MFVIIKDPIPNPSTFSDELGRVIETVYVDSPSAQQDALTLATANPGSVYMVFELVAVGAATVAVSPAPPATWTPVANPTV